MTNSSALLFGAALAASLLPLGAAEPDLSKLPAPSTKTGLTYAKDIRPLFEASCFNCHGERRQRAGLRLDNLADVLKGSDEVKVVLPGDSLHSLLIQAAAQIDDETAMPPKRGGSGFGGFGGPGGFGDPGARGTNRLGRGGFGGGLAGLMANPWFAQADRDHDQKLTQTEFTNLGPTWFSKIDTQGTGKLSQDEFAAGLDDVLPLNFGDGGGGRGRGPGGQRGGNEGMGFGAGRMLGSSLFSAADTNKDGSLSSTELSGLFNKWFTNWDTNKTGSLSLDQFRNGLAASMARSEFGQRGPGGFGGPRGPGGFGGGGGFGGPGGGGFGMFGRQALAQQMVRQGDKDNDQKLSKSEFVALADVWFDKLDPSKSGKVTQEQFTAKFADALGWSEPAPTRLPAQTSDASAERPAGRENGDTGNEERGGRRRRPDGGAFGGPASLAPGVFGAVDSDKDGTLMRAELGNAFENWFGEFDTEKSGQLTAETLYVHLREKLPQGGFGGPGGAGVAGGGFGGFGGFGGERGAPAKPLTAEEVGLVRAWIDQGAK